MKLSTDELNRRLAEADRALMSLRRATREMQELGRQILAERERDDEAPRDVEGAAAVLHALTDDDA